MTWDPRLPYQPESDKIAALCVPYLQGRFLDIGGGWRKVWPSAISVDNGFNFGMNNQPDVRTNANDLSLFADASMDAVFSSHTLEDFPREETPEVLAEWARVLKVGGYLVLYLPSANLYPKMGEPGANPAHRQDIYPGEIEAILRDLPCTGWELLESEERSAGNEYSLYIVARKRESGWIENVWQRNPGGRQRALVIRYGGIGDMLQVSSILPQLKREGYHVTLNCRVETQEVVMHDPHVDAFIAQRNDFVPNDQLGPYWKELGQRYDRVINLCESVEGALLQLDARLGAHYPVETRRKLYGTVNYLERTHDIAGLAYEPAPRFFETELERHWAIQEKQSPAILWAFSGSAPHKAWPWVHIVVAWLLRSTPAHIYLAADPGMGKVWQDAIVEKVGEDGVLLDRLHPMAGKWSVRQTLAFAQVADCVIGPETGVLNAVSHEAVRKVVMLSHSSETNLTRDWHMTTVLKPEAERVPCFPCHRLHYDWSSCHQDEATNAALCAVGIAPEVLFRAIALAIGAREAA